MKMYPTLTVGLPTQKKLSYYRVEDNFAIPPENTPITIAQKKFFKSVGAIFHKDRRVFEFLGMTPGEIYDLLSYYIDWEDIE